MDDTTLLYLGMFCFSMIGLGIVLTIYEFNHAVRKPEEKILSAANVSANANANANEARHARQVF